MKTQFMLAGAALSLVSAVASAGYVQPAPVQMDFVNRFAQGDMLSARNSDNPNVYIGCGVRHNAAGLSFGFCQAAIGSTPAEQFTCFSDNPAMVDAIKSIGDFSFIVFRWDVDGNCTYIGNSTQSLYLPDWKTKK